MGAYFKSEIQVLETFHKVLGKDNRHIIILLDVKGQCAHADLYASAFRRYLIDNFYGVARVTFYQTKHDYMTALLENRDFCFFDVYKRYSSSKHIKRISDLIDDCIAGRRTVFRSKFECKPGHTGDGPRCFIFCTNDLDNLWFISSLGRSHMTILDMSDMPETLGHWNVTPQYLEARFKEMDAEQGDEGQ